MARCSFAGSLRLSGTRVAGRCYQAAACSGDRSEAGCARHLVQFWAGAGLRLRVACPWHPGSGFGRVALPACRPYGILCSVRLGARRCGLAGPLLDCARFLPISLI